DGVWGSECDSVAARCVVKRRLFYTNRNATALVQRLLGVEADGKCGKVTAEAIRAYQRHKGLAADGAVGRLSWRALLGVQA
ncbi:MAG: peptidoglycan-binding protein, partial [Clostridia bacterium]|nr:peptidoglycan-binding protein [Clostridia bacterium]